jgi:hypothetical protein
VPDNVGMGSFFRNPLGLFATSLAVGFALLAVGMAAFGGTSGSPYHPPKPLTLAQYRRVGARLGRSMCLQLRPIVNKKPRSLRQLRSGIGRITAIFDRFRMRLYAVVPPPSRARSFHRLRNHLDAVVYAFHRADHLAETGQWRGFVLFVRSRSFKDLFKSVGSAKGPLRCGRASHTSA